MAFLDPKERILDIVLTNKGRELLSKNSLRFEFYAFSDEGIDYSGSLSASVALSRSLDDYVYRNFSFEADQRKNGLSLPKNNDLKSFLFTIPPKSRTLPVFRPSVEDDLPINLSRRFFIDTLILHTRKRNRIRKPIGAIVRATVPKRTLSRRMQNYVIEQRCKQVEQRFKEGRSIAGLPVSRNLIALSRNIALNVHTGGAVPFGSKWFSEDKGNTVDSYSIKREIEIIAGTDKQKIGLKLKNADGEVFAKDGFLIEVFLSSSDGKLTKINKVEKVDFLDDETKQDGFREFLILRNK